MNASSPPNNLEELLAKLASDDLSADGWERLAAILENDPAARLLYRKYMTVDALLRWENSPPIFANVKEDASEPANVAPPIVVAAAATPSPLFSSFVGGVVFSYLIAAVLVGLGLVIAAATGISELPRIAHKTQTEHTQLSADDDSTARAVVVGRLTGMVDCVWEGSGVGVQGSEEDTAQRLAAAATPREAPESGQLSVVSAEQTNLPSPGHRPEGLVGGRGAGGEGGLRLHSPIHLSDRLALRSGLLEITYNTGAKVILQGPVTYKVDSSTGGYLAVGKLTARLEKKVEAQNLPSPAGTDLKGWSGRGAGGEGGSPRDTDGDHNQPQSALTLALSRKQARGLDSSLASPLFTITTPTAIVTDLGTEFGVEVSPKGLTQLHVLQGVVDATAVDSRGEKQRHDRVTEGHAVQIKPKSMQFEVVTFAPQAFTRKLQSETDKSAERGYINAVLADRPLAYWPLNEPAGCRRFRDRSGNGFHGYALQPVESVRPSPLSGDAHAVLLRGNSFLDIGQHNEFGLKRDFTVEAWVCIGDMPPPCGGKIISIDDTDPNIPAGWGLAAIRNGAPNAPASTVTISLSFYAAADYRIDFPAAVAPADVWLHLAVAVDHDYSAHFYLNGKHWKTIVGNKPPKGDVVGGMIGARCYCPTTDRWQGRLAHVAVYSRVLSEPQIQRHFDQRKNTQ